MCCLSLKCDRSDGKVYKHCIFLRNENSFLLALRSQHEIILPIRRSSGSYYVAQCKGLVKLYLLLTAFYILL